MGTVIEDRRTRRPTPTDLLGRLAGRLRPPRRRQVPRQRRAWAQVLVMMVLTGVSTTLMPRHAGGMAGPVHVPWWAMAAACAAADMAQVHFHFRDQGFAINLNDVPLMVGLAFCSPHELVAARILGSFVAYGVCQRQPLVKLTFNVTDRALTTSVAVTVAHALIGAHTPVSPQGWAALAAGAAAGRVIGDTGVLVVIWLTAGRPSGSTLKELVLTAPAVLIACLSLALICVSVLWVSVWAAWTILLVVGMAAGVHVLYHRLRRRYSNLVRLYDFTGEVAAVRPSAELVDQVLEQARTILRADRASVLLRDGQSFSRTVKRESGVTSEARATLGALEDMVLASGSCLLAPRNAKGPLGDALRADGLHDALLAPLMGDDGVVGVLAVADRVAEMDPFDHSELKLFEALSQAAGVALRRGQLVEELQAEALAKEYQAYHDILTSLPNRTFFSERLAAETAARKPAQRLAVLLMDLDEFKEINDTLGHDVGDAVLIAIGERMADAVGADGLVTRLGGDEFAVLVPHEPAEGFASVARRVAEVVTRPLVIGDMVLELRTSIGVAVCPDHGERGSLLLQRADVAMYVAKNHQVDIIEYTPEQDHHSARRLGLVGDLRQALEADALELHFQPKAELATGTVYGVEALLRWYHPVHGMVPPDEFIPMAEHSGLIGPLTTWVLRRALTQQAQWAEQGIDLSMAVNISARSLLQPDLVEEVASRLREAGVPPERLTLEITESSVMVDPVRSVAILEQLSALGTRISVDDFGTGYSSLSRLTKLPVDEVKIDKSLVFNMLSDPGDLAVVRATIDLARHLELEVVAEGIEDGVTWERLRELGCGRAQGYYLSRPVPASDLEGWLQHWEDNREVLANPATAALAANR